MTVIRTSSGSESSWIASTYPAHGDDSVGCLDSITVSFSKSVSSNALVLEHFRLYDSAMNEIVDPFKPIVLASDYNEISRTLSLSPVSPLQRSSQYTLIIDGLYDPAGDDQDNPHVVGFMTSDVSVEIPSPVEVDDTVEVSDHSLLDAPLVIANEAVARIISTMPTNGAYNLSQAYNNGLVTITVSRAVDTPAVLVEYRPIGITEGSWEVAAPESVVVDSNDARIIRIQMPEVTIGVYLQDGFEYKTTLLASTVLDGDISLGTDIQAILFTGPLPSMFTSVSSVLLQYRGASSYDVARLIYMSSAYAKVVDDTITNSTPTKAASDYALYSTLWQLATRGGDQQMIQLGDLIVQKSDKLNYGDMWKRNADDALARLGGIGPEVTVKGGSHTSPFATRNW